MASKIIRKTGMMNLPVGVLTRIGMLIDTIE